MKVLDIIKVIRDSFIGSETVYTRGSCYKFYKILKEIFPEAEAYYNSDHVITKISDKYYDITGEVQITNYISVDENYSHENLDKLIYALEVKQEPEIMEQEIIDAYMKEARKFYPKKKNIVL